MANWENHWYWFIRHRPCSDQRLGKSPLCLSSALTPWRPGVHLLTQWTFQPSLSLHLVAASLTQPTNVSSSPGGSIPRIYLVAPPSDQTIPLLHSILSGLTNSASAIDLLSNVQVLQYFDMAGLVESVAEISQAIYQDTRPRSTTANAIRHLVLIQGIGSALSATQRRNGSVHANALLAGLLRSLTQLSRQPRGVLVLVEATLDVHSGENKSRHKDTPIPFREYAGVEISSAFSGPSGETLRLVTGSSIVSRTLECSFDCLLVVHGAFGRLQLPLGSTKLQSSAIVEVSSDRLGEMTGAWTIWTPVS